jgi:YidC/Oxa1 family membrane protein insertase
MDKKSIIGFLFILLILFLWPQWNKLFHKEVVKPPEQQAQEQVEPKDTLYQQPVMTDTAITAAKTAPVEMAKQPVMASVPVQPEKLITVETEDVIAVLSSYGGLIKSLKLKKYFIENGHDGDSLVQMVTYPDLNPWPAMGALTLGVEDKIFPINNLAFKIEGSDIQLYKGDEPQTVSFVFTDSSSASVRKDYTFRARGYDIGLRLHIDKPEAFGFTKKVTLGWLAPNLPTEKDYKEDIGKFAGFYDMGDEVVENNDLKDGKLRLTTSGSCRWVANRSKYFTNAIIAQNELGSEILVIGDQADLFDSQGKRHTWKKFGVGITFNLTGNQFDNEFHIYSGPLDYYRLDKIGFNLTKLVDMGWKGFRPFAIGILWIFRQLHSVLFNYGVVIIIFSILMKVVFWPLTRKSSTSMMKMKELQPKMQEIKEKFKNEPQKMNAETMKLYKEYGVNPFGSCLPLLVQLPIFWAMFSVLRNSIELRAAGFVFWITDLSQKDPYYVLVIIMGLAMFLQQKMTITDPKQKMMVYIMPVVFTFLFAGWPSGLVLYWAMFSIIGIIEQTIIKKRLDAEKAATS